MSRSERAERTRHALARLKAKNPERWRRPTTSDEVIGKLFPGDGSKPKLAKRAREGSVGDGRVKSRPDLAEVAELKKRLGLNGELRPHDQGYAVVVPYVGQVVFTSRETQLHSPTQREREHASSLGIDSARPVLRARRGTSEEAALVLYRTEVARVEQAQRSRAGPRPGSASRYRDLQSRATALFEALEVPAEIDGDDFLYQGSVVGRAEMVGNGFVIRTAIQSFDLPLDDASSAEPQEETEEPTRVTLDAIQVLVDKFEPVIAEADELCAKAQAVGCVASRERAGLRTERGTITLGTPKPLSHLLSREIPHLLVRATERYLLPLLNEKYKVRGSGTEVSVTLESGWLVTTIRPSNADVRNRHIVGDFLADDLCWHELANEVVALKPPDRGNTGPHATLPSGARPELPRSLVRDCMQASEGIRLNRTAAFGTQVSLTLGTLQVVFDPIEEVAAGHIVRFRVEGGGGTASGHLRLFGSDPLPILIEPGTPLDQGRVYAGVLLGFATLTVRPEFVGEEPWVPRARRPVSSSSSRGRSSGRSSRERQITPRKPSGSRIWTALEPLGSTRTAHWVVGHVRQLAAGWDASADAVAAAGAVGIQLRSGQTWVRPHVRGLAPGESLSFRWHAPQHVTAALRA